MKKMPKQECKQCGRKVIWAINEQGKKVALTMSQEVYAVVYPGPHDHFATLRTKKQVYVNHRIVCGAKWREGLDEA